MVGEYRRPQATMDLAVSVMPEMAAGARRTRLCGESTGCEGRYWQWGCWRRMSAAKMHVWRQTGGVGGLWNSLVTVLFRLALPSVALHFEHLTTTSRASEPFFDDSPSSLTFTILTESQVYLHVPARHFKLSPQHLSVHSGTLRLQPEAIVRAKPESPMARTSLLLSARTSSCIESSSTLMESSHIDVEQSDTWTAGKNTTATDTLRATETRDAALTISKSSKIASQAAGRKCCKSIRHASRQPSRTSTDAHAHGRSGRMILPHLNSYPLHPQHSPSPSPSLSPSHAHASQAKVVGPAEVLADCQWYSTAWLHCSLSRVAERCDGGGWHCYKAESGIMNFSSHRRIIANTLLSLLKEQDPPHPPLQQSPPQSDSPTCQSCP